MNEFDFPLGIKLISNPEQERIVSTKESEVSSKVQVSAKSLEESQAEIYRLIENLLSYFILYPRRALRLKAAISGRVEDGYIQHMVRMASREEMFVDSQQIQDVIETIIEKLGEIDTPTSNKLEGRVLTPSLDEKEELEKRLEEANLSAVFQSLVDYSKNEDNETIDKSKLNSLWKTWDNIFVLAEEDEQSPSAMNYIIQRLPKIKSYFENAKPTPSQIEYFNLAMEDINRYLEVTDHEKRYNELVELMEAQDPSQVAGILSPIDSDGERKELSRKRIEFLHSLFWLLGSQLLREKYSRISKFWEETAPDQQLCKAIDKLNPPNPYNLFPGYIADRDRRYALGLGGPSITERLKLEKAKAETIYRTLQQPGGLELLLLQRRPKEKMMIKYLNSGNSKGINHIRNNGGSRI